MITLTTRMAALATVIAVLAGCTQTSAPAPYKSSDDKRTTFRRPALHGLALEEGLNFIDRAPNAASLLARVVGGQITEWQVFDASGPVALDFQKKKDGNDPDPDYAQMCLISGGTLLFIVGGDGGIGCCWENWGCQECDSSGENCVMKCETQACRDANDQPGTGGGNAPEPGDIATFAPGGWKTFLDASTSRWSVTTPAGQEIHVPSITTANECPVCTSRPDGNICWSLPCLPAKVSTFNPGLP